MGAKEASQGYPHTTPTRQRRRPHVHARHRGGSRLTRHLPVIRVTPIPSLYSSSTALKNITQTHSIYKRHLWLAPHNSQRSSSSHAGESHPLESHKKKKESIAKSNECNEGATLKVKMGKPLFRTGHTLLHRHHWYCTKVTYRRLVRLCSVRDKNRTLRVGERGKC